MEVARLFNIALLDTAALPNAHGLLYIHMLRRSKSIVFSPIMDFPHPRRHVKQSGTKDLAGPSWMFCCTLWSLLTLVLIWGQMPEQQYGETEKGLLAVKEAQSLDKNAMTDG